MTRPLLTPDEAGLRLKLSKQTVLRRLRDGTLPGVKVGDTWRVDADKLEAFIEAGGAS